MRVLLAADGSKDARAAAEFLKEFPLPGGATIRVMTVVTLPPSALQALAFNSIQVDLAVEGAFAAVMVVLAVWRFREQQ